MHSLTQEQIINDAGTIEFRKTTYGRITLHDLFVHISRIDDNGTCLYCWCRLNVPVAFSAPELHEPACQEIKQRWF